MNKTEKIVGTGKTDMLLDSTMIKTQRKKRAWSQTELATVTGLSLRTVQRIEKSGVASLESVKALASVFELQPELLQLKSTDEVANFFDNQDLLNGQDSSTARSAKPGEPKLSREAIQLSLYVFVPCSLLMLFMLFTKLPNMHWVYHLRMSLFSDSLPSVIKIVLNLIICLFPVFIVSVFAAKLWDLTKGRGAAQWLKQSNVSSIIHIPNAVWLQCKNCLVKTLKAMSLLRKPLMFSFVLLSLSIVSIATTLEPYQKDNLKLLIVKVLDPVTE